MRSAGAASTSGQVSQRWPKIHEELPFIADEPADKSLEELFMNLRSPLRNLSWCWSSTCWPHYWPNQLLLLLLWRLRFNPLQGIIGSLLVQQTLLLQPVSTSPPLMIQLCRSPRREMLEMWEGGSLRIGSWKDTPIGEEVLEQGVSGLAPVLSLHQAASGGLHFEGL
jgi:hypothetical protein